MKPDALVHPHHRGVRILPPLLDRRLALRHRGKDSPSADRAWFGVVEIEPDAAVGRPLLRDLHRIAKICLEQLVRVGLDPRGHRAAPAALLEGDVPLGREENPSGCGERVGGFERSALHALAFRDAEHLPESRSKMNAPFSF